MDVALAVIARPFMYLAVFALLVYPLMWALWKILPKGRLRSTLFDRTLQERRPLLMGITAWAFFFLLVAWIYFSAESGMRGS